MLTAEELKDRQSMPLEFKIRLAEIRIQEWYEYHGGKVSVSFSGGKDSTVLLHIVRRLYPETPAVFVDTGLEYPEVREFVKSIENVIWLKPELTFKQVIEKYGFPVVSKETSQKIQEVRVTKSPKLLELRINGGKNGHGKIPDRWLYLVAAPFLISHKCCDVMKKRPLKKYQKETGSAPFIGEMAADSRLRFQKYIRNGGCNAFNSNSPASRPLSCWLEPDIWEYLKGFNVPYSSIYDMGYARTGCVFCAFGCHMNSPNKFQIMKKTHPGLHAYCLDKLGFRYVLNYLGVPYE